MARTIRLLLVSLISLIAVAGTARGKEHIQSVQNSSPLSAPVEITLGQAAAPLYGPWKFNIGDSPTDPKTGKPLWAEADFNDSRWENVDLTPKSGTVDPWTSDPRFVPGWTSLGHPGYMGWAWYRLPVAVWTIKGEGLALEGPYWADDAYQVFDNGKLLGSFGKFGGAHQSPVVYFNQPAFFPLPPETAGDSDGREPVRYLLAFRVWMGPVGMLHGVQPGGLHYAPLFGRQQAVAAQYKLERLELLLANCFPIFESALFLLLGIVAVCLIFIDRTDPVFAWVAGVSLFASGLFGLGALASITQWGGSSRVNYVLSNICSPMVLGGWMMVWWLWFRLRRPSWVPKAIAALALASMIAGALEESIPPGTHPHLTDIANEASTVAGLLSILLLAFILGQGIRGFGLAGWLAVPAIVPLAVNELSSFPVLGLNYLWHPFGITVNTLDLANVFMTLSVSLLLLRRLLLSIRRERQMALDLKQAQEVQEVILPEHRIVLPGLEIESEYRPALEVGGDFFQIIPDASDASLLIVAGDVAGKGLKAGMLVALLVGATRSSAELDPDPVAILAALNRRLLGRGDARATCLAMRIGKEGDVRLANAGHLPPYFNGAPVEIEGSLPLGLVESCDCSLLEFRLCPSDRLLLVSDGVPEAMDGNGKLFGFDRVLELVRTHPTARKIAETAQAFGQEDDISVIAVTRIAVAEPALA